MNPMSGCDIRLVFTLPPRENWFQYVRRVYATAINIPCIKTLSPPKFLLRETEPGAGMRAVPGLEVALRECAIHPRRNKGIKDINSETLSSAFLCHTSQLKEGI